MPSPTLVHELDACKLKLTNNRHVPATPLQRDVAEFETLAMRYRGMVMAIARRITGSMVEAEDVTQQVLMKAFVNYSRFEGRSSFSTWLVSIARNEALMWCRKSRRGREIVMSELSTGEDSHFSLDFMDSRPSPEATYVQKESCHLLTSELKQLKPAIRETLELCDLKGKSGLEAALVLGVPVSALKSRKFRGRAILRQRLESRIRSPKKRPFTDSVSTRAHS